EEIGRLRARDSVPALLAIAPRADAQTLEVLAATLGDIGDVRAAPALVVMLRHDESRVRRVAARVLGALGDHTAIGPLRACTRKHPFDAELEAAIGTSVRRIEARHGPVEAGGLTVVEPDAQGALSVAAEEEGSLA